MKFSLAEVADATDGRIIDSPSAGRSDETADDAVISGASIDSRSVTDGQLFVPIVAERDGHAYIEGAVAGGAAAVLVGAGHECGVPVNAVAVSDTSDALTALGAEAGRRLMDGDVPIIGITGSVGKTSVKDLTRAALRSRSPHANEASFNNELGVPLTLLNAPDSAGAVVVEMGARGIGHIEHLCTIARPTIGVVTAVGAVHTSEFGDIAQVAVAKGELVRAVPQAGTVVLNADSPHVAAMAEFAHGPVVTYAGGASGPTADFWADQVVLDTELRAAFVAHTPSGSIPVRLPIAGIHQVGNALAALAVATTLGVSLDQAASDLETATLSPLRMDIQTAPDGTVVINDSYNANSLSMEAALRSLSMLPQTHRVAVLGTMAELGDRHDSDHAAVAVLANELGIDLVAFGEPAYGVDPFDSIEAVICDLRERGALGDGCAVLVKGSRVAQLERVAVALLGSV